MPFVYVHFRIGRYIRGILKCKVSDIDAEIEKYHALLAAQSGESARTVPLRLALEKLYERAGQQEDAIQEFARVALFYADQGQIMKAMVAAQLIVRIDPEREEILERLGELYFQQPFPTSNWMSITNL